MGVTWGGGQKPIQYFFIPRDSLLGKCHKIVKCNYHVCQVCMEELSSLWTDFHEILCLSIFKKFVK